MKRETDNGRVTGRTAPEPSARVTSKTIAPEPMRIVPITNLSPVRKSGKKMGVVPITTSPISSTQIIGGFTPIPSGSPSAGIPTSTRTTGLGSQVTTQSALPDDSLVGFGGGLGVSGSAVGGNGSGTVAGIGISRDIIGIGLILLLAYFVLR